MDDLDWSATAVFIFFFAGVSALGFWAARWKRGDLANLHEWGLGGRRFGTWITWFLLGGDLYTAYTIIAVPAVVYAVGAYGFFAVPYTILIYPLIFLIMPRLWAVTHRHGYLTAADFIKGRYGNRWLELAVCVTGLVATMPYIALQLVGMEKVIQALGFPAAGFASHLPMTIAFLVLAVYTYTSGLRAPAAIAFVKDIMIYVFVIAAVIVIPSKLGGYGAIFDAAQDVFAQKSAAGGKPMGITLAQGQVMPFITLALGSALALFMYPHSLTGVLAASSGKAIRRNAVLLPAYSVVLGFIAIMGLMGHAAGLKLANPQDVVPQLFLMMFPGWFAGFAFAGIAIGALVPAAVMSIGAANTFTRNLWKPFVNPALTPAAEGALAKLVSLIVKVGALAFIMVLPTQFALDLQLLGGVWMIQILPALVFGLYTRWFGGRALLLGWAAGMGVGTWLCWGEASWVTVSPVFGWGFSAYNGVLALAANLAVSTVLSLVLRDRAADATRAADYDDEGMEAEPAI